MKSTFLEYRPKCYLAFYKCILLAYISEALKNVAFFKQNSGLKFTARIKLTKNCFL